ncbi:MAG TPA: ATP-binding cassette domain-containing protein [Gammaproteobacteria bacterium]|nr:ATP-binding cassette domain-containing protein [Gammaproteobacteria bacterium]
MADANLVEALELTRYYADRRAVDKLSFSLGRGEVLGFLGPNGAGKSTTMQMLCGVLAPSHGGIRIAGIDLLEDPVAAKRLIGFLPEQPPLYPELTVDEYLRYCARLKRIPRDRAAAALDTAKQRCGLTDTGSRLIGNLSKGYQQRVGIAQAIIHSPQVVVLDEPTVGLDPLQIREIRELIRELGRDHGVILSTHILTEVQMTCNRVQIMHEGKLVYSDALSRLSDRLHAGSLVAAFGRAPDTAILQGIPGVTTVETLEPGRLRIHFDAQNNPAEQVVRMSVERNWRLQELTPDSRTLEQVFMELTATDHGGGGNS